MPRSQLQTISELGGGESVKPSCVFGEPARQRHRKNRTTNKGIFFMRKKKAGRKTDFKLIFLLVIPAIVLVADLPFRSRLRAQVARRGGPIPYTATLRETVYGSEGRASVAMDETFAVRSDGSYAHILRHKKQEGANLVDSDSMRTLYLASGANVEINDFAGTKSTTVFKGNLAEFQRDPSSKCINTFAGAPRSSSQETILGEEVVDGYRTVKITTPDKWSSWYALDYGCANVKSRVDWSDREYSEKNLIELIPGEPVASLFDAPGDDNEIPPSERVLGRGKDASNCKSPGCAEFLREADKEYWANRPKK
jgi:hypothetical protein